MEENKEKKRHGKRRHYRGKNSDKPKEREWEQTAAEEPVKKRDKSEKHDKAEKHDKSGKKERREKHGRHGRTEEKPTADKLGSPVDTGTEEKNVKMKHEASEVIFEFTWADAWGLYGTGYHIVIKDNPDKIYLSWSVDLGYDEIRIGGRLQEFLDDMKKCGLASWDGRRYTKQGIFDGDTWSVKVNSLKLKCEAQGTNEYPAEWKQFLNCLHEKWKIPVSKREQWC